MVGRCFPCPPHDNSGGHTAAMMSLRKGATSKFSNKHKLNTIQVPWHLGLLVLTKPFLLSSTQHTSLRHKVTPSNRIFFFKTANLPCSLKSSSFLSYIQTKTYQMQKFLHLRQNNDRDLEVLYCPTKIMQSVVLTKPEQEGPFHLDRSHLMNNTNQLRQWHRTHHNSPSPLPKQ